MGIPSCIGTEKGSACLDYRKLNAVTEKDNYLSLISMKHSIHLVALNGLVL